MFLTSTFLSLSPDVEKLQYFTQNIYNDDYIDESLIDLKDYYLSYMDNDNSFEKIKSLLVSLSSKNPNIEEEIGFNVLNQGIRILESIYPSISDKLDLDNIYTSNYGTVIFDWEDLDDKLFSLEIGKDSIGYFIEKEGKNYKQVDLLSLNEEEFDNTTNILLKDLSNFI